MVELYSEAYEFCVYNNMRRPTKLLQSVSTINLPNSSISNLQQSNSISRLNAWKPISEYWMHGMHAWTNTMPTYNPSKKNQWEATQKPATFTGTVPPLPNTAFLSIITFFLGLSPLAIISFLFVC
jgi:hypothetical protein